MAVPGTGAVVGWEACEDGDNDIPLDRLSRGAELSFRTSVASFGSSLDESVMGSFQGACVREA